MLATSGWNSKLYINSNSVIICTACKKKFRFYEAGFILCNHHNTFKPPWRDPQKIISAFELYGRLGTNGGKRFVTKLLDNLIDQCDKSEDSDGNQEMMNTQNNNNYMINNWNMNLINDNNQMNIMNNNQININFNFYIINNK